MNLSSTNWRSSMRQADTLKKIIILNVAVFLVIRITYAITALFNTPFLSFDEVTFWLAVPSNIGSLIVKPWTIFTYMFLHWDFMHILFNMLWLFWMGSIIQEYLGAKKLVGIYIMGGLFGALAYIAAYNTFPIFHGSVAGSFALGASASVLAITVAAATLLPDYGISLLFIGNVALKWVATASVVLDLISISGENAGGHIAHLGGALFGFIYIRLLQKGTNLTLWIEKLQNISFGKKGRMAVAHRRVVPDESFNLKKKATQEQLDEILDKINRSGHGSLTQAEKDFLFKVSKEDKL